MSLFCENYFFICRIQFSFRQNDAILDIWINENSCLEPLAVTESRNPPKRKRVFWL